MEGINEQVNSVPPGIVAENNIISENFGALRAGNTTENLQPGVPSFGGPRTSEVVHSTRISTKPEPIEEVSTPVAEETRANVLEAATLPNPSAAAVESASARAADIVNDTCIELTDLKQQINDSFSEVANLLLDLATRFDLLDERINRYNMKSSHKI